MTCNLCIMVKVTGKPKSIKNENGGKFRNFAEIAGGGNMQVQYLLMGMDASGLFNWPDSYLTRLIVICAP